MGDGGGRRCVRCRTLAGLVGKQATLDALHHRGADARAGDFLKAERVADDIAQHARDLVKVRNDHEAADEQVRQGHKRNDHLGDIGNALYAAKNDEARGNRDDDANDGAKGGIVFAAEGKGHGLCDGVGLEGVIDQAEGKDDGDREKNAERAPAQPALHIISRPAAVRIAIADLPQLRQGGFHKGGRAAEEGDDPHPEDGTRTAQRNGHRDAGHVAGAHARGSRDGKCLKCGDSPASCALILIVGFGALDHGAQHIGYLANLHHCGARTE